MDFFETITDIIGDPSLYIRNDEITIAPQRLDIYIPSANLAIEFATKLEHCDRIISQKFTTDEYTGLNQAQLNKLSRCYHYNKFKLCEDKGIRLITLFEDEWINAPEVALSVIGHALGLSDRGVGGRKLKVTEIDGKDAKPFLKKYHPQGAVACTAWIGAFYNTELVGVMGFGTPTRQNSQGTELKRFAANGKTYAGMAGKMFKYYVRNYNPKRILSFSDNRWFTGGMYKQLGFVIEANLPPDYSYIHMDTNVRKHKSVYRRVGIKRHFPEHYVEELTEREMMLTVPNVERTFDCGKRRWVWGMEKNEFIKYQESLKSLVE